MPNNYPPTYTIETGIAVDTGVKRALQLASTHFAKAGVVLDLKDNEHTANGPRDTISLSNVDISMLTPEQFRHFNQGVDTLKNALNKAGIPFSITDYKNTHFDDPLMISLRPDGLTRSR